MMVHVGFIGNRFSRSSAFGFYPERKYFDAGMNKPIFFVSDAIPFLPCMTRVK